MAGFAGSKILIAGGAGFVGSNLSHALLQEKPKQIVIVDNLLSSDLSNIPKDPAVKFVQGSIADDAVLASLPADFDYGFAIYCLHGNQSSIADPFLDHANNTLPSLKLFDWLKDKKSLKKIVYAAAGCAVAEKTYEEAVATPEDAPVSLYHDSPYSISKLVGEFYGNYYFTRYKLPFVKARFQNVYGPREILGAGRWRGTPHTVWRNVTPTFIWKSLHREALPLDNAGNASRDFIFVQDLVRGLMLCALNGEPGEVYNLASGIETTIRELAETINVLTGNPTPVELKPARDWDRSGRRYGATEKSKRTIGFTAQTKLRDGLEQTIAWTRANQGLIERCIAQHDGPMTRLAKAG